MVKVNCWDCGGSGKKDYYQHIDGGVCYTCFGTGIWNESLKLTPAQEIRKRHAQQTRDKVRLADLYKQLKEAKAALTPLANTFTFEYALPGKQPPQELSDAVRAASAQIKAITIEGWEIQQRVQDVSYVEFRDAHLKYEGLNK